MAEKETTISNPDMVTEEPRKEKAESVEPAQETRRQPVLTGKPDKGGFVWARADARAPSPAYGSSRAKASS